MLNIHKEALEETETIVLHEFKLRYKKKSNTIYGFVEGKEDPCFYRGFMENSIPNDWKVELWSASNKDNVYKIYLKFDWRKFDRNQILFFVDRDLSEFLEKKYVSAENIYITDRYSIENDIVEKNTCDRVLRELCGFHNLEYGEFEKITNLFELQLDVFQKALIPVMSSILYWHRNNLLKKKSGLNNILMKHIFSIEKGIVKLNANPNNKENIIVYAHEQCNINPINREIIALIAKDFEENNHYKKFVRGKYLFWFLVEFCISINKHCMTLDFISIVHQPKMAVNLCQTNGVVQIAPRCRMPDSLKHFLKKTVLKYVQLKTAG